jgi:hypothetical protein
LLELAGATPSASIREGQSLTANLFGLGGMGRRTLIGGMSRLRRTDGAVRDWTEYATNEEAYFLRTARWRSVWYPAQDTAELYRINDDPWEHDDLSEHHPELSARHVAEIRKWIQRMQRRGAPAVGVTPRPSRS